MPGARAADNGQVSENPYELAMRSLTGARDQIAAAVGEVRELDQIMPTSRRRMVAAVDDITAELQRLQHALQRLVERSGPGLAAGAIPGLDGAGE